MNKTICALLAIVAVFSFSCNEFIEKDLTGKSVHVYTPINNTVSLSYTQNFWWEELQGADRYDLQIVMPNFSAIQQLVVDTTLTTNQFSYTLQPGIYQWRIRGTNNSSKGDYTILNLTIDSSMNLSSQTLLLNLPIDNFYSNNLTQVFSWYSMPNATNYIFALFDLAGNQIGSSQSTSTTSISSTLPSDGTFKWRVFAQNSQSSSPYSERTITIDTTNPNKPTITFLPINDTTSLNPVPLTWNNVETNAQYRVQLSTDSLFTGVVKDTTTSNTQYNFYNATIGQFYYWRVKTIDLATNQSSYTAYRRFKRQ